MSREAEPQLQPCISVRPAPEAQSIWDTPGSIEILLACVSFLVFVATLSFGFVYDDREIILNNPFLHSWRYLRHDFVSPIWDQVASTAGFYYRPVYISWLRLNYSVFGEKALGWHLTTVAAHAFATVLAFRVSLRVLRDRSQAVIAGLLFAAHPIHVENVSWITGVVDPLLAIFFLASLLCYFNWRESRSSAWLAGAVLLSLCAVLTKEPGITLAAIVFAYAWIFGDQSDGVQERLRTAVMHALPFACVAVAYLAVRRVVLGPAMPAVANVMTALLTLPGLLVFYVRQLVWPFDLSLFYDRQPVERLTFNGFLLPLLIIAAVVVALVLRKSERSKRATFSAFFTLMVLSPALWVRWFERYDFVHDRYLYLPSCGFAMLFAIIASKFGSAYVVRSSRLKIAPRQLLTAALTLVLVVTTVMTQMHWANDLLLWSHAFKHAPANPVVLNNLGASLGERGELKSSSSLLLQAVQQNPKYQKAQANLGFTLYRMGDLPGAEEHLALAVQQNPMDAHSWIYLGVTHYKQGALEQAEMELRRSIQLDPTAKGAHFALSAVLEQKGDLAGAIQETKAELARTPDKKVIDRLKQLSEKK